MTLQDAANRALNAQDAVNLSGVVHTFSEVLTEALWPEAHRLSLGTAWVNTHPITRLFVAKLTELSGLEAAYSLNIEAEYAACLRLAAAHD